MKKLIYYSPFIPIIGFLIHVLWIVYKYEIFSIKEPIPICFIPMLSQSIYFALLIVYLN